MNYTYKLVAQKLSIINYVKVDNFHVCTINQTSYTFFCDKPGLTTKIEHRVKVILQQTIQLPPYRVPHTYHDAVKSELEKMPVNSVIEESSQAHPQ